MESTDTDFFQNNKSYSRKILFRHDLLKNNICPIKLRNEAAISFWDIKCCEDMNYISDNMSQEYLILRLEIL